MSNMMRRNLLKSDKGFTLLEVLVASVILSVALLGTAGFLITVVRSDKISNEMSTAVVLAQARMEDLFQQGYLATAATIPSGQTTHTTSENYNTIANYPKFKRATTVYSTGTHGALGVQVLVTCKAFGEHSYTAKTILSRDIK